MKEDVVGLIPACGYATRLSPIPCSKEIFPVGMRYVNALSKKIPCVISEYLLNYFHNGGVGEACFIIRKDKADIPAYFSKRKDIPIHLHFLEMDNSPSASHSINFAYPYFKDRIAALGFPDMLVRPADAFRQVISKLKGAEFDIVLGLFPIEKKHKWDMVGFDERRVTHIEIKPLQTDLQYGWSIAAWKPSFSSFFHHYLNSAEPVKEEVHPGRIIHEGIAQGLKAGYVLFESGKCIDTGTPEDLEIFYREVKGFDL